MVTQPNGALELDFLRAAPVAIAGHTSLHLILVGCGGTGSYMARTIAQLGSVLRDRGRQVALSFVDPDTVAPANVPRQAFCAAELGQNKAQALAYRYGAAWGLEIEAVGECFSPGLVKMLHNRVVVIVGCVDTAAGRRAIHGALGVNDGMAVPRVWHLDCGNAKNYGQVRLGAVTRKESLHTAFETPGLCTSLPAPGLQAPDLLEPPPDEADPNRLSCAELIARNAQSLVINQRMAAEASDYLIRLIFTNDCKKFATFVSCDAGSARSLYTTPESVASSVGMSGRRLSPKPVRHGEYR